MVTFFNIRDKFIEETEIENFNDINKYFLMKLYFSCLDLMAIFYEIRILLENEGSYEKSIIFIYYFGKFFRLFITEMEADDTNSFRVIHKSIINVIKDKDETSYNKIFNVIFIIIQILKKFINSSQNARRKGNTYLNLVKISQYYKIDYQK